jgi:hypothetical protein
MKHTPVINSHQIDSADNRNVNAISKNELVFVKDQDSSRPSQGRILFSTCIALSITMFIASKVGEVNFQNTPIDPAIINTRVITSTVLAIEQQQILAQNDLCIAQNPIQETEVAFSRSKAQLIQANANLEEFRFNYNYHSTLALQDKTTHKQLQIATSAYKLTQLQKSSAVRGLQHSRVQLDLARKC